MYECVQTKLDRLLLLLHIDASDDSGLLLCNIKMKYLFFYCCTFCFFIKVTAAFRFLHLQGFNGSDFQNLFLQHTYLHYICMYLMYVYIYLKTYVHTCASSVYRMEKHFNVVFFCVLYLLKTIFVAYTMSAF